MRKTNRVMYYILVPLLNGMQFSSGNGENRFLSRSKLDLELNPVSQERKRNRLVNRRDRSKFKEYGR